MTHLFPLATRSLWNRRGTALLTVLSIALSVLLLLGIERISKSAEDSFRRTVSSTDLIIGARSGPVQLLLYSVFRIGNATNNLSWQSYQDLAAHPEVAWTIPLSLGDSHRGYRVLGTSEAYFEHFRYGRKQSLELIAGVPFADVFDAVLGAEVAEQLGYQLGEEIVLAHGGGSLAVVKHADKPFRVVGVLARTGTPVDRTVHVSLAGIEAIHADWKNGAPPRRSEALSAEEVRKLGLEPQTITAFMIGLKSKFGIFALQRAVNDYAQEPLTAILPGATLQQLWELIGVADAALTLISACVVAAGLIGMLTVILTSLAERRREMAILRSVGARPAHIFLLMVFESGLLALLGCVAGLALFYAALGSLAPWANQTFGLYLDWQWPALREWAILGLICLLGLLIGAVPAWRAYRNALHDGLTIRL